MKIPSTVFNLWHQVNSFGRILLGDLYIWRRGLILVTTTSPRNITFYLIIVVVTNTLPVLQVWLSKLVVDELTVVVGSIHQNVVYVISLAVLYILSFLLSAALDPIQQVTVAKLADQAVAAIDKLLIQAGRRMKDLGRIERPNFQDELHLVQEIVLYVPELLLLVQKVLGSVITLGGLLFLLGRLHSLLPLGLIIVRVPYLIFGRCLIRQRYMTMAEHSRSAREMQYYTQVVTELPAVKEVRVFGLGDFFLHRFHQKYNLAITDVNKVRKAELRLALALSSLYVLALSGGFWYVATRIGIGFLTLGDLALYLSAIAQTESTLTALSLALGFSYEMKLHLRKLFNFCDKAHPSIDLPLNGQARSIPTELSTGIDFHKVQFSYPEGASPVLKGITAQLPLGKTTALVGLNGSGKSTVVKLLTRMYDPDDGVILLDNMPLSAYDLTALRSWIAVVYQDFAHFSLSLRENIEVGATGLKHIDHNFFQKAVRWAGVDEVAALLPQGYDTQLTHRFEGGVELSGGEWQKIALARSFIRNADLIILDEPTSALDPDAEYRLFKHFRELVIGKTALLISHRFSNIHMADHILVLEEGCIIEAGCHNDLVALGGRYATMYELQSKRYQNKSRSENAKKL